MSLSFVVCAWPSCFSLFFLFTNLTVFNKKTLDSVSGPWPALKRPDTSTTSLPHPLHVSSTSNWTPSVPAKLPLPISEQITQHLQHRKQQQSAIHVSGLQESQENISQQVHQLRVSQKTRQKVCERKPNPAVTKVVSSEDQASASELTYFRKFFPRLDVGAELVPQIAVNQKCLITTDGDLLSQSAPEHSFREIMAKDKRSNSASNKNLLMVPQWEWAVPLATFTSDKSVHINRSSSAVDLSSKDRLGLRFKQPIWRSNSFECEGFFNVHRKPHKKFRKKAEPLSSVLRWMGISPRNTPRASPVSSRSPSPVSGNRRSSSISPNLSPVGSPFSPFSPSNMTIRPFVN